MKIEKMNDHQIRCTLTQQDLEERHIKLSELAYGSDKAKSLFHDMMEQAAMDFGFEAEDIPLMIEAIPLSPEKIVLIITKVDSPEELDTRFSNFTQMQGEDSEDSDEDSISAGSSDQVDDLLDLFDQLKQETSTHSENLPPTDIPAPQQELVRLFSFRDLDDVIPAARQLNGFYHGENTLYKNPKDQTYYLIMRQSHHTVLDFNKAVHVLSSYVENRKYSAGAAAFFEEHYRKLIAKNALTSLAQF